MKVEVREKENKTKYPYIGKSKAHEALMLFLNDDYAVCISKGLSVHDVGDWGQFTENNFEPFHGEVVLSND